MAASLSPRIDPSSEAVPVYPSSHRSIVESEPSVSGRSTKGGRDEKAARASVCSVFGNSCWPSAAERGRGSMGIDWRRVFLGVGRGGGGDGFRACGGGWRE